MILPIKIRARGITIVVLLRIVTLNLDNAIKRSFSLSPYLSTASSLFYVVLVLNIVVGFGYFLFFPETKGKTLGQLDGLFQGRVVLSVLEKLDPKMPVSYVV
jgi:hypothetical protein